MKLEETKKSIFEKHKLIHYRHHNQVLSLQFVVLTI